MLRSRGGRFVPRGADASKDSIRSTSGTTAALKNCEGPAQRFGRAARGEGGRSSLTDSFSIRGGVGLGGDGGGGGGVGAFHTHREADLPICNRCFADSDSNRLFGNQGNQVRYYEILV